MNDRLRKEIEEAVNRVSAENGCNTPDFILAEYLVGCLEAFDRAVNAREKWYGREKHSPIYGNVIVDRQFKPGLVTEEGT